MKNDLFTAIVVAIVGVVMGFVVCNLFVGEIATKSIKTIDSSVNINLDAPDEEVFNAEALNPTVEVYVGEDN